MRRQVGMLVVICAPALLGADGSPATAATADRVGFPADYERRFKVVRTVVKEDERQVATVYSNEHTVSVAATDQLPYP